VQRDSIRLETNAFVCEEQGCTLSFNTNEALKSHRERHLVQAEAGEKYGDAKMPMNGQGSGAVIAAAAAAAAAGGGGAGGGAGGGEAGGAAEGAAEGAAGGATGGGESKKRYVKGARPEEGGAEERFTNPLHSGEICNKIESASLIASEEGAEQLQQANPLFNEKGRAFTLEKEQAGHDYRSMSMSPDDQLQMALQMSKQEAQMQ
jgi:hypothetical protein